MNFKFLVEKWFRLSTGSIAFVGFMDPEDYPIITSDNFIVQIQIDGGKNMLLNKISEDTFSRSNSFLENKYRSLQTFDNIDSFLIDAGKNQIIITGHKK